MKELDLLLESWLRVQFDQASTYQRTQFESLLRLSDPELARYLLAGERPHSPELAGAVDGVLRNARIMLTHPAADPPVG
jgi:succinate dehydrogenase flavin-adding protein (antitoxin of CptAB toxin-antitoxin module)